MLNFRTKLDSDVCLWTDSGTTGWCCAVTIVMWDVSIPWRNDQKNPPSCTASAVTLHKHVLRCKQNNVNTWNTWPWRRRGSNCTVTVCGCKWDVKEERDIVSWCVSQCDRSCWWTADGYVIITVYLRKITVYDHPWNKACYVMITVGRPSPSMISHRAGACLHKVWWERHFRNQKCKSSAEPRFFQRVRMKIKEVGLRGDGVRIPSALFWIHHCEWTLGLFQSVGSYLATDGPWWSLRNRPCSRGWDRWSFM